MARELRATRYDVAFNLHGGTTATLLTRATGARHRVGFADYQYARLHNHTAPSPIELVGKNEPSFGRAATVAAGLDGCARQR